MMTYGLIFAMSCFGLGLLLNLYRLVISPGMSDRLLALDTMVINAIALLILYGVWQGTAMYFQASLLFAVTGFLSTVAYAKFILRGDVIE